MLLVMDIGNTNIVLGLFTGQDLQVSWRLSTSRERTADEYSVQIKALFAAAERDPAEVEAVLICSVVPPLNEPLEKTVRNCFGQVPEFVDPASQRIVPVEYDPVSDVGADRVVNALAAIERFGTPAIVVDFGTATTFDVVSSQGVYKGGVIAPGAGISAEALFSRAARLPRIDIRKPPAVLGHSTVTSMQSGIYYGYIGLVEGILNRLIQDLEGKPAVVATGGLAQLIGSEVAAIERIEPDLTLYGLAEFHARTRNKHVEKLL